jgi:hypothetical protein
VQETLKRCRLDDEFVDSLGPETRWGGASRIWFTGAGRKCPGRPDTQAQRLMRPSRIAAGLSK